jgi:RNA polymerase sigma-70 factor (ECF subfamily)
VPVSPRPDPASDARRAAFEALFREYHARLCGFAYRFVHSRDVAEELVQEVFLYLWEHWERWDAGAPARTYLFTAVRNAAVSYLRHQRVVQRSEPDLVDLFSRSRPTADADLRGAELGAALGRAIARLPERCRLVFTLSREQGLTYNEVADVLGISVKTVEMQMGRAYKALRRYLAPYWP